MKDRVKSWKSTTIGLIALIGLAYKGYTSGGFEVSDFLILIAGVGFIATKEKKIKSATGGHPDPDKEEK